MNALIFGANGQDGYYLNSLLIKNGIDTIGISRSGNWLKGDVSNYEEVKEIVKYFRPTYLFHFAANSATKHELLFENHATISTGTLNILEAVKQYSQETKIFLSGSGLQFKKTNLPIKETDPFEASSPYAVSRIHSVYAARYYRKLGIKAYVGYLFNHESPKRQERHISKKIAVAVKEIALGKEQIIEIGNVSVRKEWTYAGDIVHGMFRLLQQDDIYETVIGSGLAYSIENWLEACFNIIGKNWKDYVKIKENFTPEYNILVSDPATIFSIGWKPEVSFLSLAKMMIDS